MGGPIVTFGLPVVAMIAFWWEDWPGSLLPGQWPALTDTLTAVVAAFVFTLAGQAVVTGVDLAALFQAFPGGGHRATFPATLPLAAGIFTAMLQLTLVNEGRLVRWLPRIPAGITALVLCWAIGAGLYLWLVRDHVVPGAAYGAWLTVLGVWQVVPFVALRGWPFSLVRTTWLRHFISNIALVAGTVVTYVAARQVFEPARISALGGCLIAAVLIVGMLLESWPLDRFPPVAGRLAVLALVAMVTLVTYGLLAAAVGNHAWRPGAEVDDWITFASLNGLGLAVILHVAIWRRWPVAVLREEQPDGRAGRAHEAPGRRR
ncbi:hypothetical protein [Actinoplanes solisilvae]|uniref:hypothetical protein n=1 Tax=Actinoplanes solisilvae TaxID=2486853 RepID=UPI000FD9DD1F|nr:hypothetical protein [Actinoplanes solisilvae]